MKQVLISIISIFIIIKIEAQNSIIATYSVGDIPTSYNELEVFDDLCNGPLTTLSLTLPAGASYDVTSINVNYNMTASGSGWMADQRSRIKFQNINIEEATSAVGVGNATGTYSYSRTLSLANGNYPGGTVLIFQMRASRVFEGTSGCNTLTNKVDNNSWQITVNYSNEITSGKVGINNDDPKVSLDVAGGFRTRLEYFSAVSNVVNLPNNVSHVAINQGTTTGSFSININSAFEGQQLVIDNLTGHLGVLSGGFDVPAGRITEFIYSDGEWKKIGSNEPSGGSGSGWLLSGNTSTSPNVDYVGTTDNQALVFKTNNSEEMRLESKPNTTELKLQSDLLDTTRILFSNKNMANDRIDFDISSKPNLPGFGLNFASKSNYPIYEHNNMLYLDATSGNIGIGLDNPHGKVTIGGNRTLGGNFPTLSLIDSSQTNTAGAILEFRNVTGDQNYNIQSHLGLSSEGTDSYLTFSKNGNWLMRLRGDGNLGIGTGGINPSLAPLIVRKKVGNSHAIFGDDVAGVSIESAFPGIHLNSYYNETRKTLATGYTSGMEMDATVGSLVFYTSPASTTVGSTASVFTRMLVDKNGNVGINVPSTTKRLEVGGVTKSTKFEVSTTGNSLIGSSIEMTGTDNIGLFSLANTAVHAAGTGTGGVGLYATSPVSGYGIWSVGKIKVDNTVEINDAKLKMFKGATQTVEINPAETATTGAEIKLMNASGVVTIELDADFNDGDGRVITSELQINGGSDLAENFNVKNENEIILPGMLLSIDEENEGKLKLTSGKNDKKVVGVVSGANGIKAGMLMGQRESIADGEIPVALAGRVYVLTTDEYEINPGDFITTSSKPGYATKAINIVESQGAIIGKAMGKRNPTTGYVLVLVNLQ